MNFSLGSVDGWTVAHHSCRTFAVQPSKESQSKCANQGTIHGVNALITNHSSPGARSSGNNQQPATTIHTAMHEVNRHEDTVPARAVAP